MQERDNSNSNQGGYPIRQPSRRDQVSDEEERGLTFVGKSLSSERLEALREFLAHASTDEIAMIRVLYGDQPDVLKWIGLEV